MFGVCWVGMEREDGGGRVRRVRGFERGSEGQANKIEDSLAKRGEWLAWSRVALVDTS